MRRGAALTLLFLATAACSKSAYEQAVDSLAAGEVREAGVAAESVEGDVGTFLRGNVAFAECLLAEKQAQSAAAEPFAFDVAIALAEKAERFWREAAMSRDDWPAARRNVERAQQKALDLRRQKQDAQDRLKPKSQPKPKPEPKPQPETPREEPQKITEDDLARDPMLRELPPEEVRRIVERLAQKEREKREMRRAERKKTAAPKDW